MSISGKMFHLLFGTTKAPPSRREGVDSIEDWIIGGNYRVLNKLGFGGSSMVLRAFDQILKREVAIKILLESATTDEELVQLFLDEGRILASVRHANVVTVFSSEIDARLKFPFLVMEFIHGPTLDDRREEYRHNPLLLLRTMITVLEALHFCHQKRVIHLDLKPSNIMIDQNGTIRIIDFGIARTMAPDPYGDFALGTACYMAPEQFAGLRKPMPETDVYALGIMFYELLTGKPPFLPDPGCTDLFEELGRRHRFIAPPLEPLFELPFAAPLAGLIGAMLAKDPGLRPPIPGIIHLLEEELVAQGGYIGETYEIRQVLSRTDSLHVFHGRDNALQRDIVIRMLSPDAAQIPGTIDRFLEVGQRLARIRHSSLHAVHSLEREPITHLPFLTLEYTSGARMDTILPVLRRAPRRLIAILEQIIGGLAVLHEEKIAHGCFGAGAIIIDRHDRIRIVDLDLACQTGPDLTGDIAALGRLFLECLNGNGVSNGWGSGLHRLAARLVQEQPMMRPTMSEVQATWKELRPTLDAELTRIPDVDGACLGMNRQEKLEEIARLREEGKPAHLEILNEEIRRETDPVVLAALLTAVTGLERRSDLAQVMPFLLHADPIVRAGALEAVSLAGEAGVCLLIFPLLADPDPQVRIQASRTLKSFGDDRLIQQLQTFALFGLPEQQIGAAVALRRFPTPENITVVQFLARSSLPQVKAAADATMFEYLTQGLSEIDASGGQPLFNMISEDLEEHAIVCGFDERSRMMIDGLLEAGQDVVVIERRADCPGLAECRGRGIPVVIGSARAAPVLLAAGLARARFLLAITDDDETNLEIAMAAKLFLGNALRSPFLPPLQCFTHVISPPLQRLADMFRPNRHQPSGVMGPGSAGRFGALTAAPGFELRMFNLYANAARNALTGSLPAVSALQHQIEGEPLHILVIGLGKLGLSLTALVAQMLQGPSAELLHLTIIDTDQRLQESALRCRFPDIDRVVHLNLIAHDLSDLKLPFLERLASCHPFAAVYLCLEDDSLVPGLLQEIQQAPSQKVLAERAPIVSVMDSLPPACHWESIRQEPLDRLARAFHRYYGESQQKRGIPAGGDPRRQMWERLRGDLQERFRTKADHILVKLASIGCGLGAGTGAGSGGQAIQLSEGEIEQMARLEHRRIVVEETMAGRDPENRLGDGRRMSRPGAVVGEPTWADLSFPAQEAILAEVAAMPEILALAGNLIIRLEPPDNP